MSGIDRYSEYVRRYDDWVTLVPSGVTKRRVAKEEEGVSFEEEGSTFGPHPDRIVYESPFYRDYLRYITAAKGRDPRIIGRGQTPPVSISRPQEPVSQETTEVHHKFWKAYDAIAREVIRKEGYGGFIYRPSPEEEISLKDEDSREVVRSKIDTLVSDWSYWGLTEEEAREVTRRSKEILTDYLYDRARGNDPSLYSDYGEDLVTYLPEIERVHPQSEKEVEKKEEKEETEGRLEPFVKKTKEYAHTAYRKILTLLVDLPTTTLNYAA